MSSLRSAGRIRVVVGLLLAWFGSAAGLAQVVVGFDLTRPEEARLWHAAHDVANLEPTPEGLRIQITGADPYIHGPARDYPAGQPLWLRLRLKSEQGGMAQVFYFNRGPSEEASVRLPVRAGVWEDLRVPLPALGAGYRMRIDPPGERGEVILSLLAFEGRDILKLPAWPKPERPVLEDASPAVRSGSLVLRHSSKELGGFEVFLAGQSIATGGNRPLIGYILGRQQRWLDVHKAAQTSAAVEGDALLVKARLADPDGGTWQIAQRFAPAAQAEAIEVEMQVTVDQERAVAFLPLLTVFPGLGSFGASKRQALFPGLEYLDQDEPSSSEADVIGPGSQRQVPDTAKITFPLMTVLADGRYIGLIWEGGRDVCALFDSPDRLFGSGAHVMGLLYPGADGHNRIDGSLLPHAPLALQANKPLKLRALIVAGEASDATAAVRQYVALRGLPAVPDPGLDLKGYVALAGAGWLDSKIREGDQFRHAYPGQFRPQPAADAAMYMEWLAGHAGEGDLARRLVQAARGALAQVDPKSVNFSAVSHVRHPVAALLYGQVAENAARAKQHGLGLLRRFEPDGRVLYRPGEVDYGKTHFARDASGLSGQVVAALLEHATVSGDAQLLAEGLRVLRALDAFNHSVPRGAQTWECPLHTPDILASAHLVRAYTMGYELTGEAHFLEMARYWAWTGVPFIYLVNPVDQPVGAYATIAVYGATGWKAPNWMGLPVQWCGLVYADALYTLSRYDSAGPWKQLADGITASGIQQTFPVGSDAERQGLLPDSFSLRAAQRNNPAINPGTVQGVANRFYRQPPLYSFRAFRASGLLLHAPGELADVREEAGHIAFKVQGCMKKSYWVLLSGCKKQPQVRINNRAVAAEDCQFVGDAGRLILRLTGDATVELGW